LCAGAIFACAEPQPDVSSGLLAQVGDAEFYIDDLLAFERRVEAGDSLSVADHAEYLATLVDRELLVAEALSLNLQDDARLTEVLEQDSEGKLSDMMFDRQVAERATPTPEEVDEAFATGDWDQLAVSIELFLPDLDAASRVRQEIIDGLDVFEAGKLYSVDRMMHQPMGGARQFMYARHDSPKEIVERVFQIPVGGLSSPIPFMRGYVLCYIAEYRDVGRNEVIGKVERYLRKQKREMLRGAYLQHLNKALGLEFSDQGLAVAAARLVGDGDPADTTLTVYSFADVERTVGDVVESLRGPAMRWQQVTPTDIVAEVKNKHLPRLLMAADARRSGVDSSHQFLQWHEARREDLLIGLLRRGIVDSVTVPDGEIAGHYGRIKRRFRKPGYAKVRDLLVGTEAEAVAFKGEVDAGADFTQLVREYSLREGSKKGVFRVFALQEKKYGSAWMNYALNIPIGEVYGPVAAEGGFSLLEVVERYEDSFYTLEESRVRSAVVRDLRNLKQRRLFNAHLAALRERESRAGRLAIHEDRLAALIERETSSGE
tara:strand:+ start:3967 stop:5598 length:1632 start_codon:yes stop_codon:yes gene_type:complete